MPMRLHEQIRMIIENTPGKSQKGLADYMGYHATTINRMLHGARKIVAEEIPLIVAYLGVPLDFPGEVSNDMEYPQEPPHRKHHRILSDVPRAHGIFAPPHESLVPVYGHVAGSLDSDLNLENGRISGWVARHPAQAGIANAFAVYVISDSMEPRYFAGELVYVHPGRPPAAGRDCIIEMLNGDAYIKRYLRQTDTTVRVAQFNPACEKDIPKAEVKAIYTVVGRG